MTRPRCRIDGVGMVAAERHREIIFEALISFERGNDRRTGEGDAPHCVQVIARRLPEMKEDQAETTGETRPSL